MISPVLFDFDRLILDITTRCNLSCRVCYASDNAFHEPTLPVLKSLSETLKNKIISLCGGEPTLRDDLLDIVRLFNKNNTVFLITNGLRLGDYDYVKQLQNAGLKYISLSFNGFTDDIYRAINGASLLQIKLKALKNIKRAGMKVILSTLIVKGVNENQIKDIFRFCIENTDYIKELRIRTMSEVGKFISSARYSIPQLLGITCKSIGIDKEDVLKEARLQYLLKKHIPGSVSVSDCSINFHVKKKGRTFVPVSQGLNELSKSPYLSMASALLALFRCYGLFMPIATAGKIILNQRRPWIHSSSILKIGLRSWPDNIHAPELAGCKTGYYYNNNIIPFCYANIVKSATITNKES
jgi:uncharacterized Fe-S cluster-containing radical SAM superfamily protein